MKVYMTVDELWPVYQVTDEPNTSAELELDLPEELALAAMVAYEAFEDTQQKIREILYERKIEI